MREKIVSGALTAEAARDLGKSLRLIRLTQNKTLREVARDAGLSFQYVENIERGSRATVRDGVYERLPHGYGIPESFLADLLLRARVLSALERRGLDAEQRAFVWRGVEQRLAEKGVNVMTDLATIVVELMR
jgi:transcriptional regulator with XRE-family HTH domain